MVRKIKTQEDSKLGICPIAYDYDSMCDSCTILFGILLQPFEGSEVRKSYGGARGSRERLENNKSAVLIMDRK